MKHDEIRDTLFTQKMLEGFLISGLCFLMVWPLYNQYSRNKEMVRIRAEAERVEKLRRNVTHRGFYPIKGIGKYGEKTFSRIVVTNKGTLWNIAASPDIYSEAMLWPLIYDANRDKVVDPNLIYANTRLWIPMNSSKKEQAVARRRAGSWVKEMVVDISEDTNEPSAKTLPDPSVNELEVDLDELQLGLPPPLSSNEQ